MALSNKIILLFAIIISCTLVGNAQSGAKLTVGTTYITNDFLPGENMQAGWNVRLAGRLGGGVWFFAPEINYINAGIFPQESLNPFEDGPRMHILKVPVGIGWKFRTTPFQKLIFRAGAIGSHIMILDENETYNFKDIKDTYGGYYGSIGYDLRWFTIDYRYEKSLTDNFQKIEDSKLAFHSVSLGINF